MDEYIAASEISEFLYCQRAWWLRRNGAQTANAERLEHGESEHKVLAAAVEQVDRATHTWQRLLWIGVALLILLILIKLLAG
jgi:CRISPR/Cas system-associated exonuclease Cas4 (RecB family)